MIKTFEDRFKDRKPAETIELLNKFFADRGLTVRNWTMQTSIGTWGTCYKLYKDDMFLFMSNGKGSTEEFAKASGIAELYERFCGVFRFVKGTYFDKKCQELYGKNKFLKNDEEILTVPSIKEFFKYEFQDLTNEQKIEAILSNCSGEVQLDFFDEINSSELILESHKYLNLVQGSNGLAAGNNFYEAFNQAMSELCERDAQEKLWRNKIKTYKQIDINLIKNSFILDLTERIKQDNKELCILDIADEVDSPTVLVYMFDKISKRSFYSLGTFPIFDIALERCLTEINQNVSFAENLDKGSRQIPYRNLSENKIEEILLSRSTSSIFTFPENKIEDEKDGKISPLFINSSKITNKEIFDFWKTFLKNRNKKVYYSECSLSNDFSVVRLFEEDYDRNWLLKTESNKPSNFDDLKSIKQKEDELIKTITESKNKELFIKLFKQLSKYPRQNLANCNNLFYSRGGLVTLLQTPLLPQDLMDYITIKQNKNDTSFPDEFELIEDFLFNYTTVKNYLDSSLYSDAELQTIFKNLGINEDFLNLEEYRNKSYVDSFLSVYYDYLWNRFHSEWFRNLILAWTKKDQRK